MFDFLPRTDSSSDQTAPTAFKVSYILVLFGIYFYFKIIVSVYLYLCISSVMAVSDYSFTSN